MKRSFLYIVCFILMICNTLSCKSQGAVDEQLRRDIGEMLLVGFRGQSLDANSHIARDIKQYHVGSVILFEYDATTGKHHRNISSPKQLSKLCSDLQALADYETLLIGVDQEGGKVCRLRASDGFPYIPSAKYCARYGMDTVEYYAALTAQTLADAGINFNFAPVADVDVNPESPVIGHLERSFSADTTDVAFYCSLWLRQLKEHRVAGCLKHFPGHGSANGDTHKGLVDVTETWLSYELSPYRQLIAQEDVPAIMVAHVINNHIDPQWPASLSKKTITDLLRNKMGYNGVIVTDDLNMGAIINQYDYETVVLQTILAGSDLLCLSNNGTNGYNSEIVPQTVNIIQRLVHQGKISREQIHTSAERVRKLKKDLQIIKR